MIPALLVAAMVPSSCSTLYPMPAGAGTPVIDIDAADMNGNDDGNTGWASYSQKVTATSGSRWVNGGSAGGYFGQSNTDIQPVWYRVCPGLESGGPCVDFRNGEGEYLTSSLAAGAFKALHGGDMTCYAAIEQDELNPSRLQYIIGDATTTSEIGFRMLFDDAPATGHQAFTANIYNGSAAALTVDQDYAITPQKRKIVRLVFDDGAAGTDASLKVNGQTKGSGAERAASLSSSNESLAMRVGARPGATITDYFDGYIGRILCYAAAHDSTTADAVEASMRSEWIQASPSQLSTTGCAVPVSSGTADTCCPVGSPCQIIAIGDSTTYGYRYAALAWPYALQAHLNAAHGVGSYLVSSLAVGGSTASTIAAQWADARTDGYHILMMMGGTVDINAGTAGLTTYNTLAAVAQQASDDGKCVVWATPMPRNSTAGWDAAKQTEMDALVSNILATSITRVDVVDMYSAMEDLVTPDRLGTTYEATSADGVHTNELGQRCEALAFERGL